MHGGNRSKQHGVVIQHYQHMYVCIYILSTHTYTLSTHAYTYMTTTLVHKYRNSQKIIDNMNILNITKLIFIKVIEMAKGLNFVMLRYTSMQYQNREGGV